MCVASGAENMRCGALSLLMLPLLYWLSLFGVCNVDQDEDRGLLLVVGQRRRREVTRANDPHTCLTCHQIGITSFDEVGSRMHIMVRIICVPSRQIK